MTAQIEKPTDALVVVDVQVDFCPGGRLAVEGGDKVVPLLNRWVDQAERVGAPIVYSRDWHPVQHVSFREQGGPWPPHCVQDSEGAAFHPDLKVSTQGVFVSKGTALDSDQYSAFDRTGLAPWLRRQNIERVFVGGLAEDVCVRATVLDGLAEGFEVHLLENATAPVDAATGRRALDEMKNQGALLESA